jgi:hypothetical protein
MGLGGTGFQPVAAQAKACGYIFPFCRAPVKQKPFWTLLGFRGIFIQLN